jgi:ribonuclease P protein component
LVVHVCEREGGAQVGQRGGAGQARLGLVVSRAVGTAVERNRLKRQIRVAWRELRPRSAAVDCVVVVRKPAVGAAFSELAGHLESCLQSLGVLAAPTAGAALGARVTGRSV